MPAESLDSEGARKPAAWRHWARVVGLGLLLLAASQALWIWQTWPVRELLQPSTASPVVGVR